MARSMKEVHTINYYPINEGAARRAKEMNSFSDYKEGSATAEYRAMVDKAAAIAEQQKSRVDPMYHEKIDHLLDTYARKLAENMNQGFAIDARVPSVMIAGPANFPVGKKEKQNRARDSNMEEWRYIQGLLDKIRSTGMGGISADDPAAIEKLQKKLDGLERSQLIMKEVNAYYRKHGKLDGCALLSPDQIEKLKASMAANWRSDPRPFESYQLTNNNAEIRRVKTRIEQLSKQAQREFSGWEFNGGRVEMNREDNRLQVFFDGKPDADTRAELKSSGFRWAPSVGAWGLKQRRVYELDEDGNRIRDADGKFVFNAVPTTDWGSPETLEYWRQTWAELCNAKFAEKGLDVRIDHRSYERQGVDLLPTIHEGATVRAMEKKGIRTEKGEFNRWIKATNAVIRDIKKKITLLFDWIAEAKAELAKPQAPDLVSLLNAYYTQRRAGAYSQKGKVSNLKEMNETFNYLRANGIYSLEDLEHRVSEHSAATESLKKTLDEQTARMKAIKQLYDSSAAFQNLKPIYDGLQKIKFEKPRAKYKAEHEAELIQFYAARRKLTGEFPDGKVDMKKLSDEYDELEQAHETTYGEFKAVRDDLHRLWKVKSCVDTAARFNERTEEQLHQNRPQTRHKKEDISR